MRSRRKYLEYLLVVLIAVVIVRALPRGTAIDHECALDPASHFYHHIESAPPPATSVVHKQFNFHVVAPGVWRSSQPNEEALHRMKRHGLKTIINLRGEKPVHLWEKKLAAGLDLNYYNFPMDARAKQDKTRLREILQIMHEPSNHPVLIHCHGGKDRTGLMVSLYKLIFMDAIVADVRREMLLYGFDGRAFPEIINTITSWDDTDK